MIDVTLNASMGRQLVTMVIGAMSYQAMMQKKNLDFLKKETEKIGKANAERELWSDLSFDMTSRMIDKRYKGSQEFINSGGTTGKSVFKKSLTEADKRIQYIMEQNMLKSRTRYNLTISKHNQLMTDRKIKSSLKLNDLKYFL